MTIKSLLLLFSIGLIITQLSYAQSITGTVYDIQTRETLPGVNILQKGTTNGVASRQDGTFELTLESGASPVLVFSYVGFRDKEVEVGNRSSFNVYLTAETYLSDEVLVKSTRVDASTPFTYTDISKEELQQRNLGQDVPFLLQSTPSVVTTSDAGAGIGYTGIRIRGVDPARINVTINGVPVNDAESHGVFWVNLPDLASSIENVQVQRGVGTSANGAAAFGASINIQTSSGNPEPFAEVNTGIGSFGTRKANVLFGSGLMNNGWQFEGRLSRINSDGFIDRATSELQSLYLSATKQWKRSRLQANIISGDERTYQAWNGVPEPMIDGNAAELERYIANNVFNPDEAERWRNNLGNRQFNQFTYEDQVDNYGQDYYQLHFSHQYSKELTLTSSAFVTQGQGFFEEFRDEDPIASYGAPNGGFLTSDLIRRKWLDNDFYGLLTNAIYQNESGLRFTFGQGFTFYDGNQFGELIWAANPAGLENEDEYYRGDVEKTDLNVFAKAEYPFSDRLIGFVDVQARWINYDINGTDEVSSFGVVVADVSQTDDFFFINPKAGVNFLPTDQDRIYASFAIGNKEPTRLEYISSSANATPDHETLYNLETGWMRESNRYFAGVNAFMMLYQNQLVVTGELSDVGFALRQNVDDSYRMGLEFQGGVQLTNWISWSGSLTLSQNKIREFTYFLDDFDNGGQQAFVLEDVDLALSPNVVGNSVLAFQRRGLKAEWMARYVGRQYLDNTETRSRSLDPFFVNDIQVSYSFSELGFLNQLTASLLVNNVLDVEYAPNGYTYGWISGNQQQHFNFLYPQAGINSLMQLRWQF
ncbi:MAG: TonB-dependent receptor [Bacteroidota bacterium]